MKEKFWETIAETIAEMKAYEEKQQEIKVGDEVYFNSHNRGVVIRSKNDDIVVLWDNGGVGWYWYDDIKDNNLKMTGRHFPQVDEMLKTMGEE